MRQRFRPAACCLSLLILAAACAPGLVAAEQPAVIATLDDIQIKTAALWRMEARYLADLKKRHPDLVIKPEQVVAYRKEQLMREIDQALLIRYATKNKIDVSDEVLEVWLTDLKKKMAVRGDVYDEILKNIDKTDEEFRKISRARLAVEKLLEDEIEDGEIEKEYEEKRDAIRMRRCSHILYMYAGAQGSQATRSKEEAQKLASTTLESLKGGADFAKLARETSDCPSSKQGGDLNWIPRKGAMVEPFAAAVYGIEKVDELSGVIETDFGYHVIKLTGLQTKDEVLDKLRNQMLWDKYRSFADTLRKQNIRSLKVEKRLLYEGPPGSPYSMDPALMEKEKPAAPRSEGSGSDPHHR